jgi:hypothetical protein
MAMKRGVQQRQKKLLSAEGLLGEVRKIFEKIPYKRADPRGKKKEISIADSLMSGLAMFSLKSRALLQFDQDRINPNISHNLKSLYGIKRVPSDTYMSEELDEVDPIALRECFKSIFEAFRKGRQLDEYRYMDGYLLLIDGTGKTESEKVHCKNCCEKQHRDGRITYYHQVLAGVIACPGKRQVIPICPEVISKQDGAAKNDCERRATQRLLASLKKEHPRLRLTIASDALSANAPQINEIKAFGYHFIINAKPGGNTSLFEFIEGISLTEHHVDVNKNHYKFRYINGVPLNDSKNAPSVNFLECTATEFEGKRETTKVFTWVTDHVITNGNVYLIMRGGRARWKIENETFNTLKNQGYQFEHNFGHGKKNLISVFTFLLLLAFLIDQVQEAACGLFQAALEKTISRKSLWEMMRSYFHIFSLNSWKELFTAIGQPIARQFATNPATNTT